MAGAFDSINSNRRAIFETIPDIISFGQNVRELNDDDSASLFGAEVLQETIIEPQLPQINDWNDDERFRNELLVTGFYISNHPMEAYELEERAFSFTSSVDNYETIDQKLVGVCGVINELETKIGGNGHVFATFTVNGFNGMFECTMWAKAYERHINMITDGAVLYLTGKAELNGDSVKILVESAMPIDQIAEKFTKRIKITLDPRKMTLEDLVKIYELSENNPGNVEIFFEYLQDTDAGIKPRIFRSTMIKMKINRELLGRIGEIVGVDNIVIDR